MFRLATRSIAAPLARQAAVTPLRFPVQQRFYAASSLSQDSIKARIEDVLKSFEKVDATKVRSVFSPLARKDERVRSLKLSLSSQKDQGYPGC